MRRRRIYLASSWRNKYQPDLMTALRAWGHEVYDFRNPAPGNNGFAWRDLDEGWEHWTPEHYRAALEHPIAQAGFKLDADATDWADTCVLLLPSGRSAHLEGGKMVGEGKELHILMPEKVEPELMYRWATGIHLTVNELRAALAHCRACLGTGFQTIDTGLGWSRNVPCPNGCGAKGSAA